MTPIKWEGTTELETNESDPAGVTMMKEMGKCKSEMGHTGYGYQGMLIDRELLSYIWEDCGFAFGVLMLNFKKHH